MRGSRARANENSSISNAADDTTRRNFNGRESRKPTIPFPALPANGSFGDLVVWRLEPSVCRWLEIPTSWRVAERFILLGTSSGHCLWQCYLMVFPCSMYRLIGKESRLIAVLIDFPAPGEEQNSWVQISHAQSLRKGSR